MTETYDLIVRNGKIYDGSGDAPFTADIGVKDKFIKKIGDLSAETAASVFEPAVWLYHPVSST